MSMNEHETHAEIVKRMQNFARKNNSWPCSEDIKAFAVKLDAANRREVTAGKQEMPGNAAKLREAASNALAELKLFRKIHDARLHFCDIVHVGNAKLYLHDALALFTDSPENVNSGTDNVTPVNNAACRDVLEGRQNLGKPETKGETK